MSAARGINYLDARLQEYLRQSPDNIMLNPGASAVGQTLREFASTGTSTWEKPTAEWLVIHLATEIGACPHNDTLGHNQISIVEAYQDILRELVCSRESSSSYQNSAILTRIYQKLRTYEPWRRDETVRLTRTFLQCMEEIRFITKMLESRQNLFTRLKKDIKTHDEEDRNNDIPHNPNGETCIHRVEWALGKIRQQRDDIENIANEIQNSMNDVSRPFLLQLHSSPPLISPKSNISKPFEVHQEARTLTFHAHPAPPSPHHRTKRTHHRPRQPAACNHALYRGNRNIPPALLLHLLLWHEPARDLRHRSLRTVFLVRVRNGRVFHSERDFRLCFLAPG